MLPFHWRLGPLAISPVEIFAVLGIALVGFIARRRLNGLGAGTGDILDMALGALVGGAVGARLFYFLPLVLRGVERTATLFGQWSDGSGYWGGFIGGSLAIALVARLKKKPVLPVLDAIAAPLPLGFAVGKIGCFLAGCCYGLRTDSGVAFRPGSLCFSAQRRAMQIHEAAAKALPVHPAQLYELLLGVALFAGLVFLQRRSRRPGEVFLGYIVGYSAWRFAIEFLRDDPGRHGFSAGISDSQVAALVLGVLASVAFIVRRRSIPAAESGAEAPKQ